MSRGMILLPVICEQITRSVTKATGYMEKRPKRSESMKHVDFGGQNFPTQEESNAKALRQEVVIVVFEK